MAHEPAILDAVARASAGARDISALTSAAKKCVAATIVTSWQLKKVLTLDDALVRKLKLPADHGDVQDALAARRPEAWIVDFVPPPYLPIKFLKVSAADKEFVGTANTCTSLTIILCLTISSKPRGYYDIVVPDLGSCSVLCAWETRGYIEPPADRNPLIINKKMYREGCTSLLHPAVHDASTLSRMYMHSWLRLTVRAANGALKIVDVDPTASQYRGGAGVAMWHDAAMAAGAGYKCSAIRDPSLPYMRAWMIDYLVAAQGTPREARPVPIPSGSDVPPSASVQQQQQQPGCWYLGMDGSQERLHDDGNLSDSGIAARLGVRPSELDIIHTPYWTSYSTKLWSNCPGILNPAARAIGINTDQPLVVRRT